MSIITFQEQGDLHQILTVDPKLLSSKGKAHGPVWPRTRQDVIFLCGGVVLIPFSLKGCEDIKKVQRWDVDVCRSALSAQEIWH